MDVRFLPREIADLPWLEDDGPEAHPSWLRCDTMGVRADGLHVSWLRDDRPWLDPAAWRRAAVAAGATGVGAPARVLDGGGLLRESGTGWRPVTVARLGDPAILSGFLAAHARFRESSADLPARDGMGLLDHALDLARRRGVLLREEGQGAYRVLDELRGALSPRAHRAPSWGDGSSGAAETDGSVVRLVEPTEAGAIEPADHWGRLFAELVPFVLGEREFDQLRGVPSDPVGRARMRLFAFADDLRRAVVAWICDAWEPDSGIEYATYATMRLRRAVRTVRDPRLPEWIREATR